VLALFPVLSPRGDQEGLFTPRLFLRTTTIYAIATACVARSTWRWWRFGIAIQV
jgi:hypothetical protein